MRATLPAAAAAVLLLGGAAARADDTSPPVISHAPVSRGEKGKQTPLFARVTDESKIFPQVFFRFGPASAYERPIDMKPVRPKIPATNNRGNPWSTANATWCVTTVNTARGVHMYGTSGARTCRPRPAT